MGRIISRRSRPNTITLYNYVSTANSVATYQRTVIERVYLDPTYQHRLAQKGVATQDTAQLIIDTRDMATTSNRVYMSAKAWAALATKTGYFTFNPATDFFVDGNVADTMPSVTKQQMIAKYTCISVTSVATPASDSDSVVTIEVLGR